MICPECKGKGAVDYGSYWQPDICECPFCKGKGTLTKKQFAKYAENEYSNSWLKLRGR